MGKLAKLEKNLPQYAIDGKGMGAALLEVDPSVELGGIAGLVDELDGAETRTDIMRCQAKLDCLKTLVEMKKDFTSFSMEDLRSFLEAVLAIIRRNVRDQSVIQQIAREIYEYEVGHVKFNSGKNNSLEIKG